MLLKPNSTEAFQDWLIQLIVALDYMLSFNVNAILRIIIIGFSEQSCIILPISLSRVNNSVTNPRRIDRMPFSSRLIS